MQKSTFLKSVGRRIAQARADKGYSQATLAEKANISVSHLSNIERGRKSVSAEVLQQFGLQMYTISHMTQTPEAEQRKHQFTPTIVPPV